MSIVLLPVCRAGCASTAAAEGWALTCWCCGVEGQVMMVTGQCVVATQECWVSSPAASRLLHLYCTQSTHLTTKKQHGGMETD